MGRSCLNAILSVAIRDSWGFLETIALERNLLQDVHQPNLSLFMLPDPDQHPDRDVVIYDGRCGFCENQVNNLRRLDWGNGRLTFISLHDERVASRYPQLSHDRLMSEMVVVDCDGVDHGGADAVRYLSRRLPLLWPVVPILHLPGSARLWRWFYGQIAKKRYWLSEKFFGGDPTCDGDSCAIHFNPPAKTNHSK